MIKILIGGSPCTYWSIAQKVNGMYINSSLVSAQNHQRFYAFNWKVEQPEDRGNMAEKKNSRPIQPGSHLVSYQHQYRKPMPILHQLAAKCKGLNWRWILPSLFALLVLFSFVCYATGIRRKQAENEAQTTATKTSEQTLEPMQVMMDARKCVSYDNCLQKGFEKGCLLGEIMLEKKKGIIGLLIVWFLKKGWRLGGTYKRKVKKTWLDVSQRKGSIILAGQ